ncbi:MAG: DUF4199 domain-containing protein [Caulobacter sp.]|nr:DUF4199 domain-containing protein [Caulobacter sp.]
MLRTILTFGAAAGLIVALPMFASMVFGKPGSFSHSLVFGYSLMFLAFSLILVGVKRFRDQVGGGVIRFLPALGVGLGISVVASLIYVIGWEMTLAATDYAFITDYGAAMEPAARAAFEAQYRDPLFRLPMTFVEIFPVGVLVSLVAASLLRDSRFLPMKVVQE